MSPIKWLSTELTINRTFEKVTGLAFPRKTPRADILHRASLAGLFLVTTVIVTLFGVKPLVSYLQYAKFGGVAPHFAWPLIAWAIYLSFLTGYLNSKGLRDFTGATCLRVLGRLFDLPSRGSVFVIRHNKLFRVLGTLSFLLAFWMLFKAHEAQVESKKMAERLQENRRRIERLIERRPISERTIPYVRTTIEQHCELQRHSETTTHVNSIGCERDLINTISYLYDIKGTCASQPEGIILGSNSELRLSPAADYLARIACTDERIHLYMLILAARIRLELAEQGRVLLESVKAHELFSRAKDLQNRVYTNSGSIDNGLGSVFAHYIQNFDNLKSGFCWQSVHQVPDPYKTCGPSPSFTAVINTSIHHLRVGRDLERSKDMEFAQTRYENNRYDILLRITGLLDKEYVKFGPINEDPLSGIDSEIKDEVWRLRKRSLDWIHDSRTRLIEQLDKSDVLEVLITMAQLGSREIQLSETLANAASIPDQQELISANDAIQTAILMGFRSRSFFENPAYMGMCALVTSPNHGARYLNLLDRFVGIPRADLLRDCEATSH